MALFFTFDVDDNFTRTPNTCLSVTQQILHCVHSSSKKTRVAYNELSQGDEWTDLNCPADVQTLLIDVEDVVLRVVLALWSQRRMQRPCL